MIEHSTNVYGESQKAEQVLNVDAPTIEYGKQYPDTQVFHVEHFSAVSNGLVIRMRANLRDLRN